MDEIKFKKESKMSACSSPPWQIFIPVKDRPEILRAIRNECLDIYGKSFDECENRLTCFKKVCVGRNLPWLSPTAKPYLDKLTKTQNIVDNKMVIATDCSTCPIVTKCKSPCNQILDFIEREKSIEPLIQFKDSVENVVYVEQRIEAKVETPLTDVIPWDVLTPRRQEVVRKYILEGRDYRSIAVALGLYNQAWSKYEMYAAITKLSKYATIRKFLEQERKNLTTRQVEIFDLVYNKNMSLVQVAAKLSISKQAVHRTISRILTKYHVVWSSYVKKKGNKVTYHVPEMFK